MSKQNQRVKRAKNTKQIDKESNYIEILEEVKEQVVNMKVEMSDDIRDLLEQKGREEAEKNTNFFVELGFSKVLEDGIKELPLPKK